MKWTYAGERSLDPDKIELRKARAFLRKWIKEANPKITTAELNYKIEQTIDKAKYGWYMAPHQFMTRLKILLGINSSIMKKQKLSKIEELEEQEEARKIHSTYLGDHLELTEEEHGYMKTRFKQYHSEFEFNKSSDQVLLNQIIVIEILLRRLEQKRLMKNYEIKPEDEVVVKDLQEQYRRNLENLGVSRKQRVELDQSIEGNAAQLSSYVEQKLENMKRLKDLRERNKLINNLTKQFDGVTKEEIIEFCEELKFKRKHDMFPEKNIVSETELLGQEDSLK